MDPPHPPPPRSLDGYYRSGIKKWSYIKIAGARVSYHEAGRDVFDRVTAELGEFNSADENIREASGRENYNLKFVIYFDPKNPTVSFDMFGVVSEDREKIFFLDTASKTEVVVSVRISEEEAREVERDGTDPITAPPGPFTLQPEKQGRLVVISGPPGAGKSTSAQVLGRREGWVYYEVDCFLQLRNPFIPLDVPNPTIQQSRQRTLAGEGREERKALCDKVGGIWGKMVKQEEISEEQWGEMENYIRVLCEDINTQRRRIGGDWAIAGCFPFRRIREVLRSVVSIYHHLSSLIIIDHH